LELVALIIHADQINAAWEKTGFEEAEEDAHGYEA
jgi:hypothetical protein